MAIDITTGLMGNGHKYISFREVGAAAGEQQIISKDNTTTKQHFQLFRAVLACVTGKIALFDGSSKAVPNISIPSVGDVTIGNVSQAWDFGGSYMDFTNEDGTSVCISAAGTISGFLEYGWGS